MVRLPMSRDAHLWTGVVHEGENIDVRKSDTLSTLTKSDANRKQCPGKLPSPQAHPHTPAPTHLTAMLVEAYTLR